MKKYVVDYIHSIRQINNECKVLLFFYMLQCISAGIAFFIAIYLDKHLSISPKSIGIIVSLFAAGNLLGALGAAKVSDYVSPYKISAISIFIQGACFCLIALSTSHYTLGLLMFCLGFSGYAYSANNQFLITSLSGKTKQERSNSISLISVSSNIGIGLGGALVSFLSKNYSFQLLFSTGVMLLAVSIYYIKLESKKLCFFNSSTDSTNKLRDTGRGYYAFSLITIFIMGLIFAQQRVSYSLYLNTNFNESIISMLLMLNSILIILGMPSVNKFSLSFNSLFMMGLGGVLLGGGMALYQFTSYLPFVIIICVITTIGEMLGTLVSQLVCFQSAPDSHKGKAIGYYKFLYAVGTTLGTSLGGTIQQNFGINNVWSFCGLLGVILLGFSFFVVKYSRKSLTLQQA